MYQYHKASDPSPVQLSISTLKFIIFSFCHVPTPVNSSTQILHCRVFLPWHLWVAKVLAQEAALSLRSSVFAPSTTCTWWFALALYLDRCAFWPRNIFYGCAGPSAI